MEGAKWTFLAPSMDDFRNGVPSLTDGSKMISRVRSVDQTHDCMLHCIYLILEQGGPHPAGQLKLCRAARPKQEIENRQEDSSAT